MNKDLQAAEESHAVSLRLPVRLVGAMKTRAKKNRRSLSSELAVVVEEALRREESNADQGRG